MHRNSTKEPLFDLPTTTDSENPCSRSLYAAADSKTSPVVGNPRKAGGMAPIARSKAPLWCVGTENHLAGGVLGGMRWCVMVALNASLPPARTCPDPSAQSPGCSCSSVWQDALCLAPSPSTRVLVEASLPPARTCPDPSAQSPGCSCSS